MAKKNSSSKLNKSQEIRDYKDANPDAKPKQIAEALTKRLRTEIKATTVSTVLHNAKTNDGKRRVRVKRSPTGKKRGRPAGVEKASNVGVGSIANAITDAQSLIAAVGKEEAKRIIDAL